MSNRTLRRLAPFVILTIVFAALLYRAEHKAETGISQVDRHVTEITSPCLRYGPSSRQCKRAFEAAVATIDHAEACAVLRKAGLRVESCRGARLAQERRHAAQTEATAGGPTAVAGGDATKGPHTGSSLHGTHGSEGGSAHESSGSHHVPAPGKGGSGGAPVPGGHGAGGEQVPAPSSSPSESSPGSSSSSTTERVESTVVETPAPEVAAPVVKGVGGVLEGVGRTVEAGAAAVEEAGKRVSETVHETQCSLGIGQC